MSKNMLIGIAVAVVALAIGIIAFTIAKSGGGAPVGEGEKGQLPPQARQMMMQQSHNASSTGGAGGAGGANNGYMNRMQQGSQRR
jgi:hypothetical protein